MANKNNDNLPIHAETEITDGGTITYANEVIAIIAGIAASEIEGIAGMCTVGGFSDIIGKNRNITRGVKVEMGTEEVSVDLYTIVEYGQPIQKVATEAQENVRKSIEAMTGLRVVTVDVHVQGVSFEKEKKEAQTNLDTMKTTNLEASAGKDAAVAPEVMEKPSAEVKDDESSSLPLEVETKAEASEPSIEADNTEKTETQSSHNMPKPGKRIKKSKSSEDQ